MNESINKLLIAQSVVEDLKNKNKRASYSNSFVVVINAINAEIVELLKNDISKSSAES